MEGVTSNKKRVRDDSTESEFDLPEVKRLRDDLLSGFLDETFPDPETQDLDSVMKSLQQEISASSLPVEVVDLTSLDSGESQPDLGFLLEASDDELGLPPSTTTVTSEEAKNNEFTELVRVSSGMGDLWGFEDNVPSYESFELGIGNIHSISEYVGFEEGLFEYSNLYFDSTGIVDL